MGSTDGVVKVGEKLVYTGGNAKENANIFTAKTPSELVWELENAFAKLKYVKDGYVQLDDNLNIGIAVSGDKFDDPLNTLADGDTIIITIPVTKGVNEVSEGLIQNIIVTYTYTVGEPNPVFTETDLAALQTITIPATKLATGAVVFKADGTTDSDMAGSDGKLKADAIAAFETAIEKAITDDLDLKDHITVVVTLTPDEDLVAGTESTVTAVLTLVNATMAAGVEKPTPTFTFTPAISDDVKLTVEQMELTNLDAINTAIENTVQTELYDAADEKVVFGAGGAIVRKLTSIGIDRFSRNGVSLKDIEAETIDRYLFVNYSIILDAFNTTAQSGATAIDGVIPNAAFSVEWTAEIGKPIPNGINSVLILTGKPTPKDGYALPEAGIVYEVEVNLNANGETYVKYEEVWKLIK